MIHNDDEKTAEMAEMMWSFGLMQGENVDAETLWF